MIKSTPSGAFLYFNFILFFIIIKHLLHLSLFTFFMSVCISVPGVMTTFKKSLFCSGFMLSDLALLVPRSCCRNAIEQLCMFKRIEKRPMAWPCQLTIGSCLSIRIVGYKAVSAPTHLKQQGFCSHLLWKPVVLQ